MPAANVKTQSGMSGGQSPSAVEESSFDEIGSVEQFTSRRLPQLTCWPQPKRMAYKDFCLVFASHARTEVNRGLMHYEHDIVSGPTMVALLSPVDVDETFAVPQVIHQRCQALGRSDENGKQLHQHSQSAARHDFREPRTTARIAESNDLSEQVQTALRESGYPLKNIQCTADDFAVYLTGVVHRYFDLQMATAIVRRLKVGRQIELQIQVVTKPPRS